MSLVLVLLEPNCSRCELGPKVRSLRGHACLGSSMAQASLLVVTQNPTVSENYSGQAFSDEESRLLTKFLKESNFLDYRLSYAVKCHPGHEEPTRSYVEACRFYLQIEIAECKPFYILACSNTAFKSLTAKSGILGYRGIPQELRPEIRRYLDSVGYNQEHPKVLAAYSPGYINKAPKAQGLMRQDIEGVVRLCRQALGEEVPPADALWVDAKYTDIDYTQDLTWDIESTSANYRRDDFKLWIIGVDDGRGPVKILSSEEDFSGFWWQMHANPATKKVTFNGLAFDEPAMRFLYDARITSVGQTQSGRLDIEDVMPMGYLIDEAMPNHTLDAYAIRWLGVAPWKDRQPRTKENKKAISDFWMAGPQTPEAWNELKQYNARDVLYTKRLFSYLQKLHTPSLRRVYERMLKPATICLHAATSHGIYLVPCNIVPAIQYTDEQIKVNHEILTNIAFEHIPALTFNPNSSAHIGRLLFDPKHLACVPVNYSAKTQKPSTDAESIKTIRSKTQDEDVVEFTTALLSYKEAHKLRGFIASWDKKIEPDGRLHPSYFLKTETGRTSSWIHTTPRAVEIRRIIGVPPGHKLIVADLSQIELREAARQSRDPEMLATYQLGKNGGDLHTTTAKDILRLERGLGPDAFIEFDKNKNKAQRTMAKGVNFGSLYGAEAPTLRDYLWKSYNIRITIAQAYILRNDIFFARYSGLIPWYNETIERLQSEKQVTSPIGRIRRLPNIDAKTVELRAEAARQGINTKVQSFGSDVALCSFFLIERDHGSWLKPVMFHHDADLFECIDERAEEGAHIVKHYMEIEAPAYMESIFQVNMDVPLIAETHILQDWSK